MKSFLCYSNIEHFKIWYWNFVTLVKYTTFETDFVCCDRFTTKPFLIHVSWTCSRNSCTAEFMFRKNSGSKKTSTRFSVDKKKTNQNPYTYHYSVYDKHSSMISVIRTYFNQLLEYYIKIWFKSYPLCHWHILSTTVFCVIWIISKFVPQS